MDRLSATVYSEEVEKRGSDLCVSRRGEQLQLFAREYRHARDVDDTNDDIVFNEEDARDDGDKLTLSMGGAVKDERKNHARKNVRFVHPELFVRKIYSHTSGRTEKQEDV